MLKYLGRGIGSYEKKVKACPVPGMRPVVLGMPFGILEANGITICYKGFYAS
jgi:hypothetical protein